MVPVKGRYNGARGTIDRPFASPGTRVELRRRTCDGAPGFSFGTTHRVTLLFEPPAGPANAVLITDDCGTVATQSAMAACDALLGGGTTTCVENASVKLEVTGNVGRRILSFDFPDTDARVGTPSDDLNVSGPLTIAVTPVAAPLPCGLVAQHCRDLAPRHHHRLHRRALRRRRAVLCHRGAGIALRPSHRAAATERLPIRAGVSSQPPCTATASNMRLAVDADGDLLLPMGWTGVLADDNGVPVPRILRATWAAPIQTLAPGLVGTFNVYGVQLPPVFESRIDGSLPESVFTLLGSADVATTVLRVAARGEALHAIHRRSARLVRVQQRHRLSRGYVRSGEVRRRPQRRHDVPYRRRVSERRMRGAPLRLLG